jgi:hypothetical protein
MLLQHMVPHQLRPLAIHRLWAACHHQAHLLLDSHVRKMTDRKFSLQLFFSMK